MHSINLDNAQTRKRNREEDEEDKKPAMKAPQIRGLMTVVNVDEFRYRLTRWMVNRHVAFSEVENSDFQDMLKSVNIFHGRRASLCCFSSASGHHRALKMSVPPPTQFHPMLRQPCRSDLIVEHPLFE